jgi:CO/xanthine dehydrogenase FAD-binding subunit
MNAIERYAVPTTLNEAAEILKGANVTVLAGGTDLMPQSHSGKLALQAVLMNIRRIDELRAITLEHGWIRIGALATITEILDSEALRRDAPVLVEAADHFASDQLRNAATIGGNICNASPAGDMLVPLLVLDAEVELVSKPNGSLETRRLPLREFFVAPGRTRRLPQELLAAVRFAVPASGFAARFYKFGVRPALDISAISIGIGFARKGGKLSGVRVVFGAVAPTPLRATRTESVLEGKRLDPATIGAAAVAARDEVNPISDVRATAWYRKELIHNMTSRILNDVAQTGN